MSAYFRELASALRLRSYEEDEVAEIVTRAENLVARDGRPAEQVLGPVMDYVDGFPERTEPNAEMRRANVAYILVTVVAISYLVLRNFIPAIDRGPRVGIYGLGLAIVAVFLVDFARSWRRPKSIQNDLLE